MPSPKILIADHEPLIASLVTGLLKQNGYETRTEQSSSGALQTAGLFGPCLLVIDPIMPGLSGVEAATRISHKTKCKVLFLTTLASDVDFREMLRGLREQGCDCEALPKPFSKEQLIEHVRRRIGTAIIITDAAESTASERAASQESGQTPASSAPPAHTREVGEYEPLLKLCSLNLYQSNAFRITGLNVDSSLRDISREAEKLEMMIKLGTVRASEGILPLSGQLSIPAVTSALQTLKEPEQRLLHEFFWFWPCAGASKDDPAMQTLRERKYQAAVDLWTNTKGQGSGVAIHNLAVFYHVGALDGVIQASEARTGPRVEDQHLWASAYRYWKALLERSDFWDSLTRRIRDMNDPRLKIDTAHRIWSSLPNAVLGINARLAIAAAETGDFEEAGRQRHLIYNSGYADDSAKKEVLRGLGPLRDEIERLSETAEAEARANPRTANTVFRKFLVDKSRLLQTFNYLVGVGNPICDAVHDRIAEAGRVCLVAYVNETNDWDAARLLFEECLALAEGKALRSRLEEDLEIIAGHLGARVQPQPAGVPKTSAQGGATNAGQSNRAATTTTRHNAKHKWWSKEKVLVLSFVALVIVFAAFKGCEDSSTSPDLPSQPSTSIPSQPSVVPREEPIPFVGSSPVQTESPPAPLGSPEEQDLKAEIESAQVTLSNLDTGIGRLRSTLDESEVRLGSDKATLGKMERDQNAGIEVDVDEYERIRSRYNIAVNLYNEQVNEYNSEVTQYKQLLALTNAKIDRYNALGRSR